MSVLSVRRIRHAITNTKNNQNYTETYTYNAIGNIMNKSDVGDYTYSNTGFANPHAVTKIGTKTYTYDNNGNQTGDGLWTNVWNCDNRLIASASASSVISYAYDTSGQRVKKTTSNITIIYPFKHYEKEGTKITKYIYANGNLVAAIETNNGVKYIHTDHLGSTNVTTDNQGLVTHAFDYYPYGQKRIDEGTSKENKQFIGQYFDEENDLSYFNARYYDGARGQFMSQDPVHLAIGSPNVEQLTGKRLQEVLADPQVLNSYSYARNNPITNKDPEGKYVETAFDVAMFGLSLNDFREKPGFWNGVSVIADGASMFLPIPAVVGGIRHADEAVKFLRGADRAGDAARGANRAADFAGISKQYNWGNPNLLKDHTRRHAADFGLATDNYAGYAQKGNEWISNAKNNPIIDRYTNQRGYTTYFDPKTNITGSTNNNGLTARQYFEQKKTVYGMKGGGK